MRILQIFELVPPEGRASGGVEIAILSLSRELVKLGHEVTILTGMQKGFNHGPGEAPEGIKIIPVEFAGLMERTYSSVNLKFLRQAVFPLAALKKRLGSYDIYHGHVYVSGFLAFLLARLAKAKAVNTIHGSYYSIWNLIENPFKAGFYKTSERLLAPMLAKLCDLQIHTGGYFAKQLVKWGAPLKKLRIIHNGVDPEIFNPRVKPAAIEREVPIIFTARRLVKKNGVEHLVRAMPLVLRERKCSLLIAGDGPERPRLRRIVEKLGLGECVTLLGQVPHDKVASYISLADLIVVPSMIEASSLFILEAMAMQRPVIAPRAGAIPEILSRENGVLINSVEERELAEKILSLLRDRSRREKLGMKAYRCVRRKFTWARVAKQTEEEYLRILAG